MLEHLGLTAADLTDSNRPTVPTVAEYLPVVSPRPDSARARRSADPGGQRHRSAQGVDVDDEPVAHVRGEDPLVRVVDGLGADDFDLGS